MERYCYHSIPIASYSIVLHHKVFDLYINKIIKQDIYFINCITQWTS